MKTLISWPVTVASKTNELRVTANSVTALLSIPPGEYDGISYSGVGMGVGPGSFAQAFCDMMVTHPHISACTAVYTFAPTVGTAHPGSIYSLTYTAQPGDELEFSHASSTLQASALGGVDGTDYPLSATMRTPQNAAGYWCPRLGSDNTSDIRNLSVVGSLSHAASASVEAGYAARKLGEVYSGRLLYDWVNDADIRAHRATDALSQFPALAGRTVGDTQAIFERVLVAASEGKTFIAYVDQTQRFRFKIPTPWNVADMVTPVSNSGAHSTVVIRVLEVT